MSHMQLKYLIKQFAALNIAEHYEIYRWARLSAQLFTSTEDKPLSLQRTGLKGLGPGLRAAVPPPSRIMWLDGQWLGGCRPGLEHRTQGLSLSSWGLPGVETAVLQACFLILRVEKKVNGFAKLLCPYVVHTRCKCRCEEPWQFTEVLEITARTGVSGCSCILKYSVREKRTSRVGFCPFLHRVHCGSHSFKMLCKCHSGKDKFIGQFLLISKCARCQ